MVSIRTELKTQDNTGAITPAPAPTYAPEIEVFPDNNPTVTPTAYELSADDKDILLTLEEENIQNSDEIETQENIDIQNVEEAEIPDEEILSDIELKASTISMLEGILFYAQASLNTQDNSDGWISEWFDAFKQTNGIDLTQSTVESAIKKQKEIINELKETLESGEDFEAKWEELTGVKYDEEKIVEYQQITTQIQFVQMGLDKVNSFCDSLVNDCQYDVQGTYDKFVEFYGEEKGQEEFLKTIIKGVNLNFSLGLGTIANAEFNNDGNIIFYDENNNPFEIGTISDISPDNLTFLYSDKFKEEQINSYLENVEKTTGINYQESLAQLGEISNETLGEANTVNNILNEYISSQEGFVDAVAGAAQIGGMALMGIGAITMAFSPPVGGAIIKTGQYTAMAGTFGDELAERFDTLTNNQNFKEDRAHYQEIVKEAVVDIALYASGYAIGGVADDFGQFLMSKSGSKFASMIGEIGVDASLSLMSDLVITGEVDFTGEGMSQILGLITAIAGGKYAKIQGDVDFSTKPNVNNTRRLSFNPETGELGAPRAKSGVEPVMLDYPEAGDNIGMALKSSLIPITDGSKISLTVGKTTKTLEKLNHLPNGKYPVSMDLGNGQKVSFEVEKSSQGFKIIKSGDFKMSVAYPNPKLEATYKSAETNETENILNIPVFSNKLPFNQDNYTQTQLAAREFAIKHSGNPSFYSKNFSPEVIYENAIEEGYYYLREAYYKTDNFDPDSEFKSASKETPLIEVRNEGGWNYRIPYSCNSSKSIDRISLNVNPDEALIKSLDEYFGTGKVQGYYKTAQTYDEWNSRHDPITIYLNEPINQEIINEIIKISQPHIRSTEDVLVGETVAPGVAIDKSPTEQDLEALIQEAEKYDPILANVLRTSPKGFRHINQKTGNYELKTSAGRVAAVKMLLAELSKVNTTLDTDFSSVDYKSLTPEQIAQIND